MTDPNPYLESLRQRLAALQTRHEHFGKEIDSLKEEIAAFLHPAATTSPLTDTHAGSTAEVPHVLQAESPLPAPAAEPPVSAGAEQNTTPAGNKPPFLYKKGWEGFIGGNIINKIGIVITVIGVGIGAKYSIDHDLISPLTRIVIGYLIGLSLLGLAFRLKKQYAAYSAVLLGGAMAIMYFLTFIAYSHYGLFPQAAAFLLMVVFTAFTVFAALQYDLVVIAHLALVGAYGVPFLLSNNSGRTEVLFGYMALINTGILVIAFKKYWQSLLISSFSLSWFIFLGWYFTRFSIYNTGDPAIGLSFSAVFFILFYVSMLAHVMSKRAPFGVLDTALILLNAFLFYGIGYNILSERPETNTYLGLFTLLNAIIHFGAGFYLHRSRQADKNVFYLVMGVVLVFLTLAIPVQLDGRWVTLLWAGEAVVLFLTGRSQRIFLYEKLAYPVMLLAVFSLLQDWSEVYDSYTVVTPVFNIQFLSTVLVCVAFGAISLSGRSGRFAAVHPRPEWARAMDYVVPAVLIGLAYFGMLLELNHYFDQWALQTAVRIPGSEGYPYPVEIMDEKIPMFKVVWGFNYTFVFLALLWALDRYFLKNRSLELALLAMNMLVIMSFLVAGLYQLSELRELFLATEQNTYFDHDSVMLIFIRYISLGFMALLLYATSRLMRHEHVREWSELSAGLMLHTCILWLLSSELLQWLDLGGSAHTYKLGLSILWGAYALLAISLGLWKRKRLLRYGGIGLFLLTLLKLFFYDISHLGTIAKTIVFVSLGLLLLLASFLYNKYKHLVSDEEVKY